MFCRHCGKESSNNAQFCRYCGQATTNPYMSPAMNVPPKVASGKPDNFLGYGIFAALCCCVPGGIVSIVYASQVDSKWAAGDYEGAHNSARQARIWFWVSFGIGIALQLINLALVVLPGLAEIR